MKYIHEIMRGWLRRGEERSKMTIKKRRHCDIRFNRDDAAPIPHDRCERCHEEIEALATKTGPKSRLMEEHPLDRLAQADLVRAAAKWERGDMGSRSKYHREIKPGVWVDVYDVLAAWAVDNPALQHLIKKALAPGSRGHKTREQDLADIVASAQRAQELEQ